MAIAKKAAAPKAPAAKKEEKKATSAVKTAVRKAAATVKEIPAPKLNIMIQSPLGGVITPEEIMAKVPKEAKDVYVRVDENKLYWVGAEKVGSVDIW